MQKTAYKILIILMTIAIRIIKIFTAAMQYAQKIMLSNKTKKEILKNRAKLAKGFFEKRKHVPRCMCGHFIGGDCKGCKNLLDDIKEENKNATIF